MHMKGISHKMFTFFEAENLNKYLMTVKAQGDGQFQCIRSTYKIPQNEILYQNIADAMSKNNKNKVRARRVRRPSLKAKSYHSYYQISSFHYATQ